MENRLRIIDAYVRQTKELGKPPESIYRFCLDLQISEREFFSEFASFEAVEDSYWVTLLEEVIFAVQGGAEYITFTARQRFLTFGFAFLEKSLENRTMLLIRWGKLTAHCRPPFLQRFERRFKEFAKTITDYGRQTQEVADRGRLTDLYPQGLYLVFRSLIEFNLKDQSPAFERSDAFWEKSVNLAFDLIRTQALDSAIDLARFLIPSALGAK